MSVESTLKKLSEIRSFAGPRQTIGLSDQKILELCKSFPVLVETINESYDWWHCWKETYGSWLKMDERELIGFLLSDFVNFYKEAAVNPYVAMIGRGPWLVTTHGAIIHDSGGYGMLGLGQGPQKVIDAMSRNYFMANVMTANFSQKRLSQLLLREIGQTRPEKKSPFTKFICMNSGSEGMTVACRISDINAKIQTDPGGVHAGKKIKLLSQVGSFHGRTERPARASDSSRKGYSVLASYRNADDLIKVNAGDVEHLRAVFAEAERDGIFFESMMIEPVMGEGNPGRALPRPFYDEARRLTRKMNTILIMDSIQAGIRTTGYLSMVDYPGFRDADPPDIEVYSKAINAGQYPLAVVALTEAAGSLYKKGVYGNTMTTNPRALEVACTVLGELTPELRKNIQDRGIEFLEKFNKLKEEFPGVITQVQGTGLLFSVELNENGYTVLSDNCVELDLRLNGFGVIHGGKNALRFTPHFAVTSQEIDMIVDAVRTTLKKGPIFK
jgi:acetylornithine/succinyldiaminopimelate/putrescine aminotransferase